MPLVIVTTMTDTTRNTNQENRLAIILSLNSLHDSSELSKIEINGHNLKHPIRINRNPQNPAINYFAKKIVPKTDFGDIVKIS